MICPECHHRPSERLSVQEGGYTAECHCRCHDAADRRTVTRDLRNAIADRIAQILSTAVRTYSPTIVAAAAERDGTTPAQLVAAAITSGVCELIDAAERGAGLLAGVHALAGRLGQGDGYFGEEADPLRPTRCEHDWHRNGTRNGVPYYGCQTCGAERYGG